MNLNFLRTFISMMEFKSLNATSQVRGINKSAVSKQLTKLSEELGYSLFERGENGLEATPEAIKLYPLARQLITQFDQMMVLDEFDSANYDKPIKVSIASSLIEKYGCNLFEKLQVAFPNASIDINTWRQTTAQDLLNNETHLGIHYSNPTVSASLYQKRMFDDEYAFIVSKNQPIPTFEEVLSWPFLAITSTGWNDNRYRFIENLSSKGIDLSFIGSIASVGVALEYCRKPGFACVIQASNQSSEHTKIKIPDTYNMPLNVVSYVKTSDRHSPFTKLLLNIVHSSLSASK